MRPAHGRSRETVIGQPDRVTEPTGSARKTRIITGREQRGHSNAQKEASPPSLMSNLPSNQTINVERNHQP